MSLFIRCNLYQILGLVPKQTCKTQERTKSLEREATEGVSCPATIRRPEAAWRPQDTRQPLIAGNHRLLSNDWLLSNQGHNGCSRFMFIFSLAHRCFTSN